MTVEEIALVRNLVAYERFLEDLVRLLEEKKVPDTFMHQDKEIALKMFHAVDMICALMGIEDDEQEELD
jgi:hypothetical protein